MRTSTGRSGLIWAVVDHASFAGASFVLNVILARTLSAEAFGLFVVAYAAFLWVATIHGAFSSEPAMVVGPGQFKSARGTYTRIVLTAQSLLGLVALLVLSFIGLLVRLTGQAELGGAIIACGLATPFVLTFWTVRRLAYAFHRPKVAAWASATYLVLSLGGIGALNITSIPYVFGILAMSALVAASIAVIGLRSIGGTGGATVPLGDVLRAHWTIGRWAAPSSILKWVPDNIFVVLIPVWYGLAGAAELKVALFLVLPVINVMSAVAMVFLPRLAAHRGASEGERFLAAMRETGIVLSIALLCYSAVLITSGDWVVGLLFGDRYHLSRTSIVLAMAGAAPIVTYVVYGHALRALEDYPAVFRSYCLGAGATLVIGMPLTYLLGTNGALAGILAAYLCISGAMWYQFRRRRSHELWLPTHATP